MLVNLIYILCLVSAGIFAVCTDHGLWQTVGLCVLVMLGTFVVLLLIAAAVLGICCAFVDYNKPQEQDSPFYRKLAGIYIDALIKLLRVRVHTQGLEKTPAEGRFLLVCNHLFDADPGILLHYFKDSQLTFISKQENRKLPFVGPIMHKILCQLIDRENDRQALRGIINCINIIKEDKASVAVFPEGWCSKDNKLHDFRPGVFKIAMKTGVPIVVCTIQNTRSILKNAVHFKPTDVQLHLVEVITAEQYAGMKTPQLSEMIHDLMLRDLGPDFVP